MPSVHLDMAEINDECDGKCEAGHALAKMRDEALSCLTKGDVHGALEALTAQSKTGFSRRPDRMEAAFLEWLKLPADQRHAFWDDTHGKRASA